MGVKLKDFDKKLEKTLAKVLEVVNSDKFLQQVGKATVQIIRKRTQLGKGVDRTGGSSRKLDKLSDSYVEVRRNKLGFWTNSKGQVIPINTLSGKELKAFRADKSARKQISNNRAEIKRRNPKLSSKTSPKKSNLTRTGSMLEKGLSHIVSDKRIIIGMKDNENAKKAALVSKRRPFLNLSKAEINKVTRIIRDKVKSISKSLLSNLK